MLRLRGGWIFDPSDAVGGHGVGDLLVEAAGRVQRVASDAATPSARDLDCEGCWITPGWVDLRTHLREPGEEHKETIESGLRAAAAGGFTAVCPLPATRPVHDVRAVTEQMMSRAANEGVRLWPFGAITKKLEGRELTEMADMLAAGIVGVSDDRIAITDLGLLRRALEYARTFDLVVALHCDSPQLSHGAQMHEGAVSTDLGLTGSPPAAEITAAAAAIALACETGARLHLSHLSTSGAIELVRRAKHDGLSVSADVTPHHLTYTDAALIGFDPMYKVLPPFRDAHHRAALRDGVNDGTIDAIATDHAPHVALDKSCEFDAAKFGVIGLELAASMICALIADGALDRERALAALSDGAAKVLRRPGGFARGDVTVIDPRTRWQVSRQTLRSKSTNTPLLGQQCQGVARYTLVESAIVYERSTQ